MELIGSIAQPVGTRGEMRLSVGPTISIGHHNPPNGASRIAVQIAMPRALVRIREERCGMRHDKAILLSHFGDARRDPIGGIGVHDVEMNSRGRLRLEQDAEERGHDERTDEDPEDGLAAPQRQAHVVHRDVDGDHARPARRLHPKDNRADGHQQKQHEQEGGGHEQECAGDVLLAFTDGVPEAHNPEDEEFGEERLRQQLRRTAHLPANEIGARLSDEMKAWIRDAEQYDDLTFIVMKVR
jgi:hypothetical protein